MGILDILEYVFAGLGFVSTVGTIWIGNKKDSIRTEQIEKFEKEKSNKKRGALTAPQFI